MKRLLLLATMSLSLASSVALAQDAAPPPPPAPPAAADGMTPPPPGGPRDPAGPNGPEGAMKGEMGKRGPEGRRPPPPPSKAAHYRVETDEVKIDLKCADDEPAKACADLLMSTIDKLGVGRD